MSVGGHEKVPEEAAEALGDEIPRQGAIHWIEADALFRPTGHVSSPGWFFVSRQRKVTGLGLR